MVVVGVGTEVKQTCRNERRDVPSVSAGFKRGRSGGVVAAGVIGVGWGGGGRGRPVIDRCLTTRHAAAHASIQPG